MDKSNFNKQVFTEEIDKSYTILQQQKVIIKYLSFFLDLYNNGELGGIKITQNENGDIIITTKEV